MGPYTNMHTMYYVLRFNDAMNQFFRLLKLNKVVNTIMLPLKQIKCPQPTLSK